MDANANEFLSCSNPEAAICHDGEVPSQCPALGFRVPAGDPGDGYYCINAECDMTIAQVPELEDYAAAAFLALALTIGWQMRQRNRPLA